MKTAVTGRRRGTRMEARKKRVLIVDDDAGLIKVMRIYFENSGIEAPVEQSGIGALKAIDAQRPDVVIMDIRMPGMDGLEVCRAIRRDPVNSRLPIIVMTGFHSESKRKEAAAAGVNLYLTKPVVMAELLKHVKELTSQQAD